MLLFKQQEAFHGTSSRKPISINPTHDGLPTHNHMHIKCKCLAQLCLASAATHKSSSMWVPGKALYNSFFPPFFPVLPLLKVGHTCIQSVPAGGFMARAAPAVQSPAAASSESRCRPGRIRLLLGFLSRKLSFQSLAPLCPERGPVWALACIDTNRQTCF